MLNLQNESFKTKDELQQLAPSIFTMESASNTSTKYSHIPTYKIIEDMELLGWKVVDAKEVKARKQVGFQKHLVVFRNSDIAIAADDGDDVFPQILLTNSHDGKNAFLFQVGLFRLICENGLVISTQDFDKMKIRHMGYSFEELQALIQTVIQKLPLTIESMNKLKQIELNQEEMVDFAKKILEVRFGEDIENITIDYEDFLSPIREEDKGQDLWKVFNSAQEKIISGDFYYKFGAKLRKSRKIKNFKQNIETNRKMWEVVETYCN